MYYKVYELGRYISGIYGVKGSRHIGQWKWYKFTNVFKHCVPTISIDLICAQREKENNVFILTDDLIEMLSKRTWKMFNDK